MVLLSLCIIFFSSIYIMQTSASTLTDIMPFKPEEAEKWRLINQKYLEISRTVYAHQQQINPLWHEVVTFLQEINIFSLNRPYQEHGVFDEAFLRKEAVIQGMIQQIPQLNTMSFSALQMHPEALQALNTGMIIQDAGFHMSYTSLQALQLDLMVQASEAVEHQIRPLYAVFKIHGKGSRPISPLTKRISAEMIWPRNSFFRIIHKQPADDEQHMLFELEEISAQEASTYASVFEIRRGEILPTLNPNCLATAL